MQDSDSFIKGVSKGIIGLVTKPVGAVAELVNQTGQGFLRITGVNRIPPSEHRLQRRALNKEFSRYSISMVKCLWKLIIQHSSSSASTQIRSVNALIEVVYNPQLGLSDAARKSSLACNQLTACYLILNDHTLFVVDKNEDMLLRAFYITQIELSVKLNDKSSILIVELQNSNTNADDAEKNPNNLNEYELLYQNTLDRLVDFIEQQQNNSNQNSKKPHRSGSSSSSSLSLQPLICNDYYKFEKLDYLNFFKYCNGLPCICGSQLTSLAPTTATNAKQQLNETTDNTDVTNRPTPVRTNSSECQEKEMPKIHRIQSVNSFEAAISKKQDTSRSDDLINKQQKFVYYIDPRLADNFLAIFNSLKKKLLNKGFQF